MATRRLRRTPNADQQVPHIRARGSGVHEIFGAFERRARIELPERAFDIAAGKLGAFDRSRIDDGAGILGWPVGAVRPGRKNGQRLTRVQQARSREREVGISAAPAMPRGKFDRRLPSPYEAIGARGAQGFDELPRDYLGVAIEPARTLVEFHSVHPGLEIHSSDREVDIGDDDAFDGVSPALETS